MPFTVSHIAGIIPFTWMRLPVGALVIGSMVPDLPIYLKMPGIYHLFHSPLGVFTVDLAAALLLSFLWIKFWRTPIFALIPRNILKDWPPSDIKSTPKFLIALIIGICSHVIWDNFTHSYGFFVKSSQVLQSTIGDSAYTVFHVLQHLSSALGLLMVVGWLYIRSKDKHRTTVSIPKLGTDNYLWMFWIGTFLVGSVCALSFANTVTLEQFLFESIVIGMDVTILIVSAACLSFHTMALKLHYS